MTPSLAVLLFSALVAGFLWVEQRDTPKASRPSLAMWIPTVWFLIIGSRMVSQWLNPADINVTADAEGGSLDRNIFLGLIVAAAVVISKRKINWETFGRANRMMLLYFGFILVTCLWSDVPFSSFKRWIKDIGNILMAILILTEADPTAAVRTLLARGTLILLPMSMMLIKYFLRYGRYYDPWTGIPGYGGVTTNKNMLGVALFIGGAFIAWKILELYDRKDWRRNKLLWATYGLMAYITAYLFYMAQSATAIVCFFVAMTILLGTRLKGVRRRISRLGINAVVFGLLGWGLDKMFGILEFGASLLGRDLTLTDRTIIWGLVLDQGTNPLFGVGYYSFWSGQRQLEISSHFSFLLNSAHNSYLETYLNTGLIGLGFLLAFMISVLLRTSRQVATGQETFSRLQLACMAGCALYGMTEGLFNRLSPVWFLFIVFATVVPRARHPMSTSPVTVRQPLARRPVALATPAEHA